MQLLWHTSKTDLHFVDEARESRKTQHNVELSRVASSLPKSFVCWAWRMSECSSEWLPVPMLDLSHWFMRLTDPPTHTCGSSVNNLTRTHTHTLLSHLGRWVSATRVSQLSELISSLRNSARKQTRRVKRRLAGQREKLKKKRKMG